MITWILFVDKLFVDISGIFLVTNYVKQIMFEVNPNSCAVTYWKALHD